ncbi:MAG: hypothetical protein ACI9WC_003954 [Arenicella sp.]|jgi:hypothetical protein
MVNRVLHVSGFTMPTAGEKPKKTVATVQAFSNDFKNQNDVSLKDLIIDFTQTRNYTLRK